ncbi:unnamed protein product [Heterotrigona itama]|uniref:Uncharacterized protein n=1 Tax=Heterotrigona itama TaxID=395501 RepID=A0A6V7H0K5_9HYME|nr:unnamed protein product [Heterotrigona itama]
MDHGTDPSEDPNDPHHVSSPWLTPFCLLIPRLISNRCERVIISIQRYHTDEFKQKAVKYCIRFGHSLWSVNQLPAQEAKQITNLLLLSGYFYPVMLYRRVQKESNELLYIRFGHSLWSVMPGIVNPTNNDDSEDQKQRDREIRLNRGRSNAGRYENIKSKQSWKVKLAKYLVNDLKNYGPGNLMHINAISTITGKPIRIWRSKCLHQTINDQTNRNLTENFIDIEYHAQLPDPIGHWTLLDDKDPVNVELDLNACLFSVIAAQTGKNTNDLKTNTIDFLTKNTGHLISQINKFATNNNDGRSLMIGGARYVGASPKSARIILDNSQNIICHKCKDYGHPRGHASNINATGPTDSVENYSLTTLSKKSGFLSRTDQDNVAHVTLTHAEARRAMDELNDGATSKTVTLSRRDLQRKHFVLPQMKEYKNGRAASGKLDILRVTIVLRHHQGKFRDPDADVFVHTFYPRSN